MGNTKMKYPGMQIFIIAISFFAFVFLFTGVGDLEHYSLVYKNPLTVTATVTRHDSYTDSDDDTTYHSYVTYTVDGKTYSDIRYQSTGSEKRLEPIGNQIQLRVSPLDPAVTIASINDNDFSVCVSLFFALFGLSLVWNIIIKSMRNKDKSYHTDREALKRDLILTVISRIRNVFLLLYGVIVAVIKLRFDEVTHPALLGVSIVSLSLWVIGINFSSKQMSTIKRDEFELVRSVLVNKEIKTGDDSVSYHLTYKSSKDHWETSVSKTVYEKATIDEVSYAAYLSDIKNPIIFYDNDGCLHDYIF